MIRQILSRPKGFLIALRVKTALNHPVIRILLTLLAGLAVIRAEKPNILMILVDDLGYGDLSCYGATDLNTPNIDNLMSRGMRFDQFYANCTVCSPTRASLLTGRYPDLVGVPGVIRQNQESCWGHFRPNGPTLPKLLKKSGYHTALIGKWHLGLEPPNVPNDRGFDYFHGFLGDMMNGSVRKSFSTSSSTPLRGGPMKHSGEPHCRCGHEASE